MNTDDNSYNGWCNYETWSIALYIDNDEPTYNKARKIANSSYIEYEKMNQMKELVYNYLEFDSANNFQQQLLQSALENVDYKEIIKHYKEE